jgi:Ca-activated chloride channel family protein
MALGGAAAPQGTPQQQMTVADFARANKPENRDQLRDGIEQRILQDAAKDEKIGEAERKAGIDAASKREAFALAKAALSLRRADEVQTGKLGVDLAIESNNLRNQSRLTPTAVRMVGGRKLLEIGGVWIDDGFHSAMKTVTVKAQSPAYFRLLERQPQVKDVFRLGNHLLWVTRSGTALVIDTSEGKDELTDAETDALFIAAR